MLIETISVPYRCSHATFATDTSFPSVVPTITEPTGDGILDWGYKSGHSGTCQNGCQILIVGTGANDAVITGLRVYAWNFIPKGTAAKDLWIPYLLCELAAVLGSATGVATSPYTTTTFFADTITVTTGDESVSIDTLSPTSNIIAHAVIDAKAAQKLGFYFELGANATGAAVFAKPI